MIRRTRSAAIGMVLETVTLLSRSMTSTRSTPFGNAALTRTQWDILFLLARAVEPVPPGRVAERLGVTAGAVTQNVEQLRQVGLVDQSRSVRDGRVRELQLTDTARAQVEEFESAMVARMGSWFDALDDREISNLSELLTRVEDPR